MAHELEGSPYVSFYWNRGTSDPLPRPQLYTDVTHLVRIIRQEMAYRKLAHAFLVTDASQAEVDEIRARVNDSGGGDGTSSGIELRVFNGDSGETTLHDGTVGVLHELEVALVQIEVAAHAEFFMADEHGDLTMPITFERHGLGKPSHHDGRFNGPAGRYFHWRKEPEPVKQFRVDL
jgi:hypothetical protein